MADRPGPGEPAPLILVVEDDPSVRGLLGTLLAAEGYQVSAAADGVAGLAEAAAHPPALVLLDVVMPDLGGLGVLEELAGDPALAGLPVFVVSGRVDQLPQLRDRIGADRVFAKPFDVDRLLRRVAEETGGPPHPSTIRLP